MAQPVWRPVWCFLTKRLDDAAVAPLSIFPKEPDTRMSTRKPASATSWGQVGPSGGKRVSKPCSVQTAARRSVLRTDELSSQEEDTEEASMPMTERKEPAWTDRRPCNWQHDRLERADRWRQGMRGVGGRWGAGWSPGNVQGEEAVLCASGRLNAGRSTFGRTHRRHGPQVSITAAVGRGARGFWAGS